MAVKSIAVLAIVVVLVAGLAVNGSRAQPLPAVSVAAQQCQTGGAVPAGSACRPLLVAPAGALETDDLFGANDFDNSDPEWHWQQLVARVVVVAASWFAEHFGRVLVPDGPDSVSETIFDLGR